MESCYSEELAMRTVSAWLIAGPIALGAIAALAMIISFGNENT